MLIVLLLFPPFRAGPWLAFPDNFTGCTRFHIVREPGQKFVCFVERQIRFDMRRIPA